MPLGMRDFPLLREFSKWGLSILSILNTRLRETPNRVRLWVRADAVNCNSSFPPRFHSQVYAISIVTRPKKIIATIDRGCAPGDALMTIVNHPATQSGKNTSSGRLKREGITTEILLGVDESE